MRLADASGYVILNTLDGQVGQQLSDEELASGEPIWVAGQRVGTLLTGGRGLDPLSQAEQDFLDRVQGALVISTLVAIGAALGIGFLLFRGITAPLRRLTQATAKVSQGDLSVQVPVSKENADEIDQLSMAFNQMISELATADQLRRSMTADIAHELRTPLTVMQGNIEAILDGVYPADAEHLEPVLRKTQLLRRLVEDLRTLALADAGELHLYRAPVDLPELVRRTVTDFMIEAQAAGIELSSELPSQMLPVWADAARFEQVLGILLDNALRHTGAGGEINVSLRYTGGEIWLSVRDTGEGIPPQDLPHVFERFYRGRVSPHRPGGTGLGLAIAQAIVTAHGGRIWVESQPGKGTTVTAAMTPHVDDSVKIPADA
jgi:signal transduction histidine kinase